METALDNLKKNSTCQNVVLYKQSKSSINIWKGKNVLISIECRSAKLIIIRERLVVIGNY